MNLLFSFLELLMCDPEELTFESGVAWVILLVVGLLLGGGAAPVAAPLIIETFGTVIVKRKDSE